MDGIDTGIKTLYVDNDKYMLQFAEDFFEDEANPIDLITCKSPENTLDIFNKRSIDCIVSDYDMPSMDGIELLKEIREIDSEIPFIILTGRGSEEIASKAISEGVSGYLKKQPGVENLQLLSNRIQDYVENVKSKSELERYAALVDHSTDHIMLLNKNLTVLYQNRYELEGYDIKVPKMIGESPLKYVHDKDVSTIMEVHQQLVEENTTEIVKGKIRFEFKDDEYRWIEYRAKNLLDTKNVEGILVSVNDITDKTMMKKELQRKRDRIQIYEDIIDDSKYGLCLLNLNRTVVFVNNAFTDYFCNENKEDIIGSNLDDIMPIKIIDEKLDNSIEEFFSKDTQNRRDEIDIRIINSKHTLEIESHDTCVSLHLSND